MEELLHHRFDISSLTRADLEHAGFDGSKVDDSTMLRLAQKLGDAYFDQNFWDDLELFADELGIPLKDE